MTDQATKAKKEDKKSEKAVDPMKWYGHTKEKGKDEHADASLLADLISLLMPLAKFGPSIGELVFFGPILYRITELSTDGVKSASTTYSDHEIMSAMVFGFMLASVDDDMLAESFGLTGELIALMPYLGSQLHLLTVAKVDANLATLLLCGHRVIGLRMAFMQKSEQCTKLQEAEGNKHKPCEFGKYFSKAFIAAGTTLVGLLCKYYDCAERVADLASIAFMAWAFTEALNAANLVMVELMSDTSE